MIIFTDENTPDFRSFLWVIRSFCVLFRLGFRRNQKPASRLGEACVIRLLLPDTINLNPFIRGAEALR